MHRALYGTASKPSILTLVLFLLLGVGAAQAKDRPNVLIIYTDDQGSIDAKCYGSDDLTTPNIDRLAETGVRFTSMTSPSAICSASRAGLLTGRYPARAGVPSNVSSTKGQPGMPGSELTIAELFKGIGYATGHVGKWHLGYTPETMPNAQGFDDSYGHMGGCIDNYSHFFYWQGPNRHDLWRNGEPIFEDGAYFGDSMVREVKRFVDEHEKEPFFLYWAINWPHYPLQGTDKWREHYKELKDPRRKYAAFVSSMDERIGWVLDHLERRGLRENTIIVFQSDHGHSVEDRTFGGGGNPGPYRGAKGSLFEGGIRVPSIISWPGTLPENTVREQFVNGCDWWPTLAEYTGAVMPDDHQLDGKSMVAVIKDPAAPSPHESFIWIMGKTSSSPAAIREGKWKLLLKAKDPRDNGSLSPEDREAFLADLEKDPGETTNLASDNPELVRRLKAKRDQFLKELSSPPTP